MRSKKIDVNREKGRDEENRMDAKEEKVRETHNSCVLSLAVTLGKFNSAAELLCCLDLMNIHV